MRMSPQYKSYKTKVLYKSRSDETARSERLNRCAGSIADATKTLRNRWQRRKEDDNRV
jgi:hypothetical protein